MMSPDERYDVVYQSGYEHHQMKGGFREDAEKECPYTFEDLRNCWLRGWQDSMNEVLNSHA